MSSSITLSTTITVATLALGLFYLLAPKEILDKYAPDALVGYAQSSCTRQTIGAVLVVAAIFLNNQPKFRVITPPAILSSGFNSGNTEKFFQDYSRFPDYETFVV